MVLRKSRIKRRGVGFICSSLKHGKAECPLRGGTTSGKGPSTEPGVGGDAHGGKAGSKGSGKEGWPMCNKKKNQEVATRLLRRLPGQKARMGTELLRDQRQMLGNGVRQSR